MHLILDLQACQTASRARGIGRYVGSLARGILALRDPTLRTRVALDGTYPEQASRVRSGLRDLLPASDFSFYHYPRPHLHAGDPADPRRYIASQLIARHHAAFCPDAVLHGSLFEGYVEPVVTCEHLQEIPGAVSAAIVYDLIPLVYPDSYLAQASGRAWYFRKLQAVRNCDLLLAISEATRRDVIDKLAIPPERVAVIDGAADPIFRVLEGAREGHEATLRRLGITRRFVLYTGNADFRKNIHGALEAFARLPDSLRQQYQLVLNQANNPDVIKRLQSKFGLNENEVVVTGYIDDQTLVVLFNCCDLFLFPSLYEGFGLPVLEAMACGAPVIGGDNSAIPELIENPEARFDATDPSAIAACMQRALTDNTFRQSLREGGARRASELSWQRSAKLAVEAIEEAVERKEARRRPSIRARRRLAMFTPLPPEPSGIANYSAELLPSLARHFSVDVYTSAPSVGDAALEAAFRIRPWHEFEAHSQEYDGIVYQMGNSSFHGYMAHVLERHPGIVVMHDFFLSSLFWYMDHYGGRPGAFRAELAYCHGAPALIELEDPDGDAICRRRYPCNRRVIECSKGIIAHSAGIYGLLEWYGLNRIARAARVVPQIRALPTLPSEVDRNNIRIRMGYRPDDWLVCSFGFIADTKLSDRLLLAAISSDLRQDARVHFALVGELDGGEYGEELRGLIASSGMAERIRVTGFVEDATYQDYLSIADVAVQMRASSRGETSRAVLDCLAYGIPVIVNAHGTMRDYPESVVVRLAEEAEAADLAAALTKLYDDPSACRNLSAQGRNYIAREHAPDQIAADYAAAIDELLQRDAYLSPATLARDLAPAVVGRPDSPELIEAAQAALSHNTVANPAPALIVDLSEVVHTDYGTGIHRVVRNLCRELVRSNGSSYRCLPAFLDGDHYRFASEYARDQLGIPALPCDGSVEFAAGDALLLLDSAWNSPERFLPVMREAESRGAEIVGYVYDLVPILHPETCAPEMPQAFRRWLEHTVRMSHAIICISRATADDLIAFIGKERLQHRPGLRIHYVHLGSDLEGSPAGVPTDRVRAAVTGRMTFLVVGTLEPRKGHPCVLAAFEQLWSSDADVGLCLIGKPGWKMEPFVARLRSHPEFGRRLHWLEYASDADVEYAYRHAAGLLQASIAEGFGLPLLEAAHHGTPVLCTDIPVFREVAGTDALYFPVGSSDQLAQLLRRVMADEKLLARKPRRQRTWCQAAEELLQKLGAHPAYHVVD